MGLLHVVHRDERIIHRHNLDVRIHSSGSHHQTTNTSETIDTDFDAHDVEGGGRGEREEKGLVGRKKGLLGGVSSAAKTFEKNDEEEEKTRVSRAYVPTVSYPLYGLKTYLER